MGQVQSARRSRRCSHQVGWVWGGLFLFPLGEGSPLPPKKTKLNLLRFNDFDYDLLLK